MQDLLGQQVTCFHSKSFFCVRVLLKALLVGLRECVKMSTSVKIYIGRMPSLKSNAVHHCGGIKLPVLYLLCFHCLQDRKVKNCDRWYQEWTAKITTPSN